MYSPDHADVDPRNPANYSEANRRFIVADYKAGSAGNVTIIDILNKNFGTEEEAVAAILALTTFHGEEVDVLSFDVEGDETVEACYVWDGTENGYVKA